jgi:hypothetical protein
MFIQSGGLEWTHCEGAWGTAPAAPRGGEIYLEGYGDIIEPDLVQNSATNFSAGGPVAAGQATCGVHVLPSVAGPTNIKGRHARIALITGAADNGGGLVRITCTAHGYATNDRLAISAVGGVPEANGQFLITVIDANTFDLQGSTFLGTSSYTSGGIVLRPTVRINGPANGAALGSLVNIEGIPSKEIDFTLVTGTSQPTLSIWQPQTVSIPTYQSAAGGVMICDMDRGNVFFVNIPNAANNNFTLKATNIFPGCRCTLYIANNSGGSFASVISLDASFQATAGVSNPASGRKRTITFVGAVLSGTQRVYEIARNTLDI